MELLQTTHFSQYSMHAKVMRKLVASFDQTPIVQIVIFLGLLWIWNLDKYIYLIGNAGQNFLWKWLYYSSIGSWIVELLKPEWLSRKKKLAEQTK